MFNRILVFSTICLLVLLFWVLPALAQLDTAWVRRYNGPDDSGDQAFAIAVDGSGNVYVTGSSYGPGTDEDCATVRYYPNGDTAWVRRYDGPASGGDATVAIAVEGSGNVYVTGDSEGSPGDDDYITIKYYASGDTAWVRRYEGSGGGEDDTRAIAADASGNVYVTGRINSSGNNDDVATIKYLPNGDTAWVRIYDGPASDDDGAYAIAVDGSGNVYVTGLGSVTGSYPDYLTIKYLADGKIAWVKTYNGPGNGNDLAMDIALDGFGNVYVTGFSDGDGTGSDYATIKYDADGDTVWVRRYNGAANLYDVAGDLAVDGFGNVYVTGFIDGDATRYDYVTIKYHANGDTAWVRSYNGPDNSFDEPRAIALDGLGNVYVTGKSRGSGTFDDYTTIMYDSSGNQLWVNRYDGIGSFDGAYDLAVDDSGAVYVTGGSSGGATSYDYVTIKYVRTGTHTVQYDVGDGPTSVFCADLDGVNGLDLAVTNGLSNNVSILKNNGDATYQGAVNYATSAYPYSVFCANLDLDPDLDLATANVNGDNVSILMNNGDGSFGTKVDYDVGDSPRSVFCADFEDDNEVDLAVAVCGKDSVCIRENKLGTFDMVSYFAAGDCPFSVYCADLDGVDGPDLAVANWDGDSVSILINNGFGTFQAPVNYGVGNTPASVFCADLDGVGGLDLALANWGSDNVSVLMNNGDGTFQAAVNYAVGDGPRSIFCADLDQDTDLDLVVANEQSDSVSLLMNNGDGTFRSAVNYPVGDAPRSVYCANLDGNSYPDVAVANFGSDNVSLLFNPGMSTDIEDEEEFERLPEAYYLSQNYPNPFNPTTKIEFVLHRSGDVRIDIYSILGRKIKTLVDQEMSPGRKLVDWDGRDDSGKQVASGIYFYRLKIGDYSEAKKMLLLK